MPAVPNATEDQPVKLERVEVSPGNFIKMNAADKAAFYERQKQDAATRAAWERTVAGEPAEGSTDAAAAVVPLTIPLTILTKAELVELAEKRGLATSGSKDKIAARFAEPDDEADEDDADSDDETEDDQEPA